MCNQTPSPKEEVTHRERNPRKWVRVGKHLPVTHVTITITINHNQGKKANESISEGAKLGLSISLAEVNNVNSGARRGREGVWFVW
jgi:hypothetical protein